MNNEKNKKFKAMNTVLSVKDLEVVFSGFKALKGVNLDVGDREIVTIIGPNGAGKSTLLDAIVSKSPVSSGHIYYQGVDITNKTPYNVARMGIGRKFQNPNVIQLSNCLREYLVSSERIS